jgi:hypothetical protein
METPFLCKINWHKWIYRTLKMQEITFPKQGPHDPRSDKERTYSVDLDVCAKCGKRQVHNDSW